MGYGLTAERPYSEFTTTTTTTTQNLAATDQPHEHPPTEKKAGSLAMAKTPILLSARTFNEWTTCMAVACDDDERFLMLGTYSSDEIAFLVGFGWVLGGFWGGE